MKATKTSGKDLLKAYFKAHINEDVHTNTIKQVAENDLEYVRRIRELKSEGMVILTSKEDSSVPQHHYRFTGNKTK